jgi:DNA transposition AAA+ family ATPase
MEEDNRQRLSAHIAEGKASQNKVARAIGISGSALSQWLSGTYKGDNSAVDARVEDYLSAVAEEDGTADLLEEQGVIETSAYRTVTKFCDGAAKNKMMSLLIGEAGSGKTTALRDYARKHPASILIEADIGYTPRVFFNDLCSKLKISAPNMTYDKFLNALGKLKNSGRLLIIDEAEHLPNNSLEYVRRLHDKAGIAIVLCGMPRLEHQVRGDKEQFLQLSSRIQLMAKIKPVNDKDLGAYIESRYENFDSELSGFLVNLSGRNMRTAANICKLAFSLMQVNGMAKLNKELLQEARSSLL